jgi:hypothetical protein
MANFERTETIICSITIKNSSGTLVDPATSVKIGVTAPNNTAVVTAQDMTNDSVGAYHYDYTPAATVSLGEYKVRYTATDGARVTIQDDVFSLVG